MSYLDKLRKNRDSMSDANKKALEDDGKSKYGDSRFWKLTRDKTGNGSAVIRFLPAPENESVAFVNKFLHNFQGKSGQWFVENCPTTIKGQCPVCSNNSIIWKNNPEKIAREKIGQMKRQHKYYSNILVVEDEAVPENNGKVFLFEYGTKIFEKIKAASNPQSSRVKAIDPFEIDLGANFIIQATIVDKQVNYDSSFFEQPTPVSEDDKELEKILGSMYSLQALVSKENFKSEEELEKHFKRVQNGNMITDDEETEMSEDLDNLPDGKDDDSINIDDLPF